MPNGVGRLARALRWSVLPLLAVTGALAAAAPAAAPKPSLWGRYVLAYASCDAAGGSCRQELAQSRDSIRWSAVVGFTKRPGEHPVAVRRGSRLYVFDGLTVRRFTIGKQALTELPPAAVQLDSGQPPASVDVVLDQAGTLVVVYTEVLETGDVAVRTATEQTSSDGTVFVTDPGDRVDLSGGSGPVSMLRTRSGWVGLLADSTCLRVLQAGNLRGTYRDSGCLTAPSPISSPSGYWNARLHEFWLYGAGEDGLRRATASKLTVPLRASRFRPLRSLGAGRTISAARFAAAQARVGSTGFPGYEARIHASQASPPTSNSGLT